MLIKWLVFALQVSFAKPHILNFIPRAGDPGQICLPFFREGVRDLFHLVIDEQELFNLLLLKGMLISMCLPGKYPDFITTPVKSAPVKSQQVK